MTAPSVQRCASCGRELPESDPHTRCDSCGGLLQVRHAPPAVADAFCAGRLENPGRAYGTLPSGVDAPAIIERALAA